MNTRRISIRSLWFYMVRKLWLILLCAVCCGALLAGYKYYKDSKENTETEKENDGSSLSETERNDVENAALQYKYATELEIYMERSPLMQVNSKGEDQVIVEYRILLDLPAGEASFGTVEGTYIQLLRAYINDGLFIGDLIGRSAEYEGHPFLKELVWCNNSGSGEYTLGVMKYDAYPNLVEDVRAVVEAYIEELKQMEPRLRIDAMKEGTVNVYDSSTDSVQKNTYSNMVTYRKNYTTAYNGFSSSQQSYFRYLTGFMKDQGTAKKKNVGISKRYAAVGIVVGFAGGVCLCFLLLYLSLKHATPSDYSENLGLRNFGLITTAGKKKHPLRSWLMRKELKDSLFEKNEDSVDYAAVRIGVFCDNHEIDRLAVLSSKSSETLEKAVTELAMALRKQEVDLLSTEKVGQDSKALAELVNTGRCILLEELRGGNRKKAAELLQFCKENDVEVIGAIGVAEIG